MTVYKITKSCKLRGNPVEAGDLVFVPMVGTPMVQTQTANTRFHINWPTLDFMKCRGVVESVGG